MRIVSSLFAALIFGFVVADAQVFWTEAGSGTIRYSDLVGQPPVLIASGLGNVSGIAVDSVNFKLYWTVRGGGGSSLSRSDIDGGNPETLISSGLGSVFGLALDIKASKLYWADETSGKIQRSDLSGTDIEDVVTGLSGPEFLALDLVNNRVYFTNFSARTLQVANLDGSGLETLYTGPGYLEGVALDLANGDIYVADFLNGNILKVKVDGSGAFEVVTGLSRPIGLAIDIPNGKLYWVDQLTGFLQCSNKDGSEVETVLSGLATPKAISVIPQLPAISFGSWMSLLPFEAQGVTADPDKDGIVNLLEYALGSDPLNDDGTTLPAARIYNKADLGYPFGEERYLGIKIRMRKDLFGVSAFPEAGESPGSFSDVSLMTSPRAPLQLGGYTLSAYYYPLSVDDPAFRKAFIRLRVNP